MESKRDSFWGEGEHPTLEYFRQFADGIHLDPDVDEAVHGRFELVRKLVEHSYFEADFLDAAFERALLTYEMALRRRFRGLYGPKGHDLTKPLPDEPGDLNDLIGKAHSRNLLGVSQLAAHSIRRLRNYVAHPQDDMRLGFISRKTILRIAEVINSLYKDPALRTSRNREIKIVNNRLAHLVQTGAVLEGEALCNATSQASAEWKDLIQRRIDRACNARPVIADARLLHLDNESDEAPVYHYAFTPAYEIESEDEESSAVLPYLVVCSSWENAETGALRFTTCSGATLRLCHRLTQAERARVESWETQSRTIFRRPFLSEFLLRRIQMALRGENAEGWPDPLADTLIVR